MANYTRLEAETYAYLSGCSAQSANPNDLFSPSGSSANPLVNQVGGFNNNNAQSFEEMQSFLDVNKTSYIQYFVDAATAGTYTVKIALNVVTGSDASPYIAVFVNDGKPQKVMYPTDNIGNASVAIPVDVSLTAGRNSLIFTCLPNGSCAPDNWGWLNYDYLDIPAGLTGINAQSLTKTTRAVDAAYIQNFASINKSTGELGGGNNGQTANYAITTQDLCADNVQYCPYFSLTVNAPIAGYYEVAPIVGHDTSSVPSNIGVLVNGKNIGKMPTLPADTAYGHDRSDFMVHLNQGDNVLIFTAILPSSTNASYLWVNFYNVTLNGGVTVSATQQNPDGLYVTRLEAETYGELNKFANPKDSNSSAYSGGFGVGGADDSNSQSMDEMAVFLDKNRTPYVQFTVDAPADGTYEVGVGFMACNYVNKPFVALLVNDGAPQKVQYCGGWHANYYAAGTSTPTTMEVALKAGRNILRVTGLTKENRDSGNGGWVNIDYLYIEKALTGVKPADAQNANDFSPVRVEAENTTYYNRLVKYTDDYTAAHYSGGYDLSKEQLDLANAMGLTLDKVTVDNLDAVPYFSVTVNAPKDGFYDMSVGFSNDNGTYPTATYGLMVDGVVFPHEFSGAAWDNPGKMDATTYLPKGEHVLTVMIPIPKDAAELASKGYNNRWINFDYIDLNGGLTVAATQKDPRASLHLQRMEAETDAELNLYSIESNNLYSGCKAAGMAATGNVQSYDELKSYVSKSDMPYVQYTVDAPADGNYPIRVGINVGGSGLKNGMKPYSAVIVNDTVYKAEFTGNNGAVQAVPLTVALKQGRNIIRCTAFTKDQLDNAVDKGWFWLNQDYLDVSTLADAQKTSQPVTQQAESLAYFGNYSVIDDTSNKNSPYSNKKALGNGNEVATMIGITTANLSADNFDVVPYFSVTVHAPVAGYYTVAAASNLNNGDGDALSRVGLLVNGKKQVITFHSTNNNYNRAWMDALVSLEAGDNVLVFTGILGDTFTNSPTSNWRWIDYDYIQLSDGLTVSTTQQNPIPTNYTRLEAETYGVTNLMTRGSENGSGFSGGSGNGSAMYGHAQTFAEIESNGIDRQKTPYTCYSLQAPADGTYNIRLRLDYGTYGQVTATSAAVAVVANDSEPQMVQFNVTVGSAMFFTVPVKVTLKKGMNTLIVTEPLGGSYDSKDKNTWNVWLNQDYIEVDSALSGQKAGERVEAEAANSTQYGFEMSENYSNDEALGSGNTQFVLDDNITYDRLNAGNMAETPMVNYDVIAPQAGAYEVYAAMSLGAYYNGKFAGDSDITEGFVACMVNGGAKQKITCYLGSVVVAIKVNLKQGKNTISISGPLRDEITMPNWPDTYDQKAVWVNHDYLDLPWNLTPAVVKQELNTGRNDNIGDPQFIATEAAASENPDTGTSPFAWPAVLFLGGSALGISVVTGLRIKKKKVQ